MKNIKYLAIFFLWSLGTSNAFAGFADGFRAGSQAGDSWVRTYEAARYKALLERQERERRRTGIIDFIESKRHALVDDRLREIQREINDFIKSP